MYLAKEVGWGFGWLIAIGSQILDRLYQKIKKGLRCIVKLDIVCTKNN